MYIIPLILVALSGLSKAIQDTLAHHFTTSIFSKLPHKFWDASTSWKNKYANYDAGDYRDKFFLSSTLLVAFTDAWHLFDNLRNLFLISALTFAFLFQEHPIVLFWTYLILFQGFFHVPYTYLKQSRKDPATIARSKKIKEILEFFYLRLDGKFTHTITPTTVVISHDKSTIIVEIDKFNPLDYVTPVNTKLELMSNDLAESYESRQRRLGLQVLPEPTLQHHPDVTTSMATYEAKEDKFTEERVAKKLPKVKGKKYHSKPKNATAKSHVSNSNTTSTSELPAVSDVLDRAKK